MKPFRDIDAEDVDSFVLREAMDAHGYVLIRRLLTARDIDPLLSDITAILRRDGWLANSRDPRERIADPTATCGEDDATYKQTYERVFSLPSFHELPHHRVLQAVMKALVGQELLIHPKSVARLVFPNFARGIIRAHQDHTAVAGDADSFTGWLPLHDCPLQQGPLRILEGSHRFGLQPTAGHTGYIAPGTERGGDWVEGEINAGDLLLFHSLTVHEAAPNTSDRLRISIDFRFQNYLRPVNPAALVFPGSGRRSWEKTYADWPSDELKYYWTHLPLQLKPSRQELAELAQTAERPEMRLRYARTLERLDMQMLVAALRN
jgi:ectoine hydroxylase-related dioxygenase (phytanoyl-CoA dioxygenase family)